jgi:protein O-GlcNAc transferase
MNMHKAIQFALKNYQGGDLNQAKQFCKKALKIQPNNAEILNLLGVIYFELKNFDPAIQYFKKALQFNPKSADAYFNLGNALKEDGNLNEAITYYQKALNLNPNLVGAYNNLGILYQNKQKFNEAISCYQKALQLNSNFVDAYYNLGNAFREKMQLDEAITYYQKALDVNPNFVGAYTNLLCAMLYSSRYDPHAIFLKHVQLAKKYTEHLSPTIPPHRNERTLHRKLKIGYLSPDFTKHAVSYFIEPVLIAHNREHFEVFCYSNVLIQDEVTKRIQEHADHWRDIVRESDEKVAELIRKDEIDILVDLAGYTVSHRLLVFALKPAPLQVTWIGYPFTTGLSTIDYKIVDNYSDPPGTTDQFYTEKLLRLPESFLCYLPHKDSPQIKSLPAITAGHITFGSFNNFLKVTPEVFTLWSRVLNAIPDSRLIMKGTSFADKMTCQYVIEMFTQKGIDAERIIFQSYEPSPAHLESYNLVDIGLDTFPWNGITTTCEAMWMGVPVITLSGTAYASRGGVSLLSNVGLPDLVATTFDEYVSIAINLARDLKRLESLREDLRNMMTCSPLCDSKRFTINLEMSLRKIWEKWCQSVFCLKMHNHQIL